MLAKAIKTIILLIFISITNPVIASGTLEKVQNKENIVTFELEGVDKQTYRLSDYLGKVVLVNFWASWCPPCMREVPAMLGLEKSLADRPFEIIAINVAEQKRKVIYQAKLVDMTFTILLDPNSKTFKQWQAKILPTSFLLDKKGHIRYLAQGPLEWDSNTEVSEVIEKLLVE